MGVAGVGLRLAVPFPFSPVGSLTCPPLLPVSLEILSTCLSTCLELVVVVWEKAAPGAGNRCPPASPCKLGHAVFTAPQTFSVSFLIRVSVSAPMFNQRLLDFLTLCLLK